MSLSRSDYSTTKPCSLHGPGKETLRRQGYDSGTAEQRASADAKGMG